MVTLVYTDGGDSYFGRHKNENLNYWKEYGSVRLYKYLYKGYYYFDGNKYVVVIYDNVKWSKNEKLKRKSNGFLGIREYKLM